MLFVYLDPQFVDNLSRCFFLIDILVLNNQHMKKTTPILLLLLITSMVLQAQIESGAGKWKTWLISSALDYRLPKPISNKDEIAEIIASQHGRDKAMIQQITYWNAGPPSYRWHEM